MTDAAQDPFVYRDVPPPRRRHPVRWIVAIVLLLVLVGGVVVAELTVRSFAGNAVAAGIEQQLPEGVDGDVDVQFGGVSVIVQYLTGELDEATLVSRSLTVGGAPVDARVEARGIPVDGSGVSGPIREATGTITIPRDSIATLIAAQGVQGDIALGDGTLTYRTATEILGQSIGFEIGAVPSLDGGRIVFLPQSAAIDGAAFEFDATELLGLVAPQGLGVCVAQYLPAAISLDSVAVTEAAAVIDLSAANVDPASGTLTTTGTCS